MCTVTFVPGKDTVYLTSNRDEKSWRKDALPPRMYEFENGSMFFPRDADAGGTWIAVHENGNAIVFLNGAFMAHQPKPPYRKSRGLVLVDLLEASHPAQAFQSINLHNIEPFTAVVWDHRELFECRWDGSVKYQLQLDETRPHIWSSSTLYDENTILKRKGWFEDWLTRQHEPNQESILHFHQFTGEGDDHNDLRMNRNGVVYTVSVTSFSIHSEKARIQYLDLRNNQLFQDEFVIEKSALTQS